MQKTQERVAVKTDPVKDAGLEALLREASAKDGTDMVSSGNFLATSLPSPEAKPTAKDGRLVGTFWVDTYKARFNINYRLTVRERTHIKSLLLEYGAEDTMTVMKYYIENHREFRQINGHPSVVAFFAFRKTIFPHVLVKEDGVSGKKGQYTGKADDAEWGDD